MSRDAKLLADAQGDSPPEGGVWSKISFAVQFFVSVAIAAAAVLYLTVVPGHHEPTHDETRGAPPQVATEVGPNLVRVEPDSELAGKLASVVVAVEKVSFAKLRVPGSVVASYRPGMDQRDDYWQFDDPDVLDTFQDWQRAKLDIEFAKEQLERVKELAEVQVAAQKKVVDRLERLVRAGTDTEADLEIARAEYLSAEIEGRQSVHEASTDLRVARQEEAVARQQLQLAGLEPRLLEQATTDDDIVLAFIPEEHVKRVFVGQQCEARLPSLPGRIYPGEVRSIAPALSRERRAVSVLFFVEDPDDEMRPGLFADIAVGTEPRAAVLIPTLGVIHIGLNDYVFVATDEPGVYRVVQVSVGMERGPRIEIESGLQAGDRVLTQGAILLKPVAVAALQQALAIESQQPAAESASPTEP